MGFFSFFSKEKKESLNKGLFVTKQSFFSKLANSIMGKATIDDEVLENLEEILLTSDVGVDTSLRIIDRIKKRVALKKVRPPLFQNVISAKKLFDLREPLYENYANLIIDTDEKSVDQVIKEILKGLNGRK